MGTRYRFTAPLWEWPSRDNWFFVSLPQEASAEIAELPMPPRGFGSIPVRVTVGSSRWSTSIFPGGDGAYTLPIKAVVRSREGIERDGEVEVELELVG